MIRFGLSLLLALSVGHAAFAANADLDIDKVNGSIHIPDNATAGALSTVNGSIHIGANAQAKSVETVNGGIEVGSASTVQSLQTVNGGIHLAEKVQVAKTIDAVNGSITLGPGAGVRGKLSNVNGSITLDAAHVGGDIQTVSGDITIGANSRVEGGVLVNKDHSWFHFGFRRKPRIVIGPHAVVQGTLTFKRTVDLYVSDSASVGKIEGATATKFRGEQPPQ